MEKRSLPIHSQVVSLTPKFAKYLDKHKLDPSLYTEGLKYRYIRLHPTLLGSSNNNTCFPESVAKNSDVFGKVDLKQIAKDLGTTEVELLENSGGFCRIPNDVALSKSSLYKAGKLYGMDISSGAAVLALELSPFQQVLELCCAPGAKLCMMADCLTLLESAVSDSGLSPGSVTGVDISSHRLAVCRSLIKKYKTAHRTRLFLSDASSFNILPPKNLKLFHGKKSNDKENQTRPSCDPCLSHDACEITNSVEPAIPFFAPRHLRSNGTFWDSNKDHHCYKGYDRVLVDAECTHDGSIAHVIKYLPEGQGLNVNLGIDRRLFNPEQFDRVVLDEEKLKTTTTLQLELIKQGYKLLKPGGILVYSTCSFTTEQNELLIARFLATFNESALLPVSESIAHLLPSTIPFSGPKSVTEHDFNAQGIPTYYFEKIFTSLDNAVRYDPVHSGTSGLFLIRFFKPFPEPEN